MASADFLVLRTPLLPFRDLLEWTAGVSAPGEIGDDATLEAAMARDREQLRTRLREMLDRPEIREAVFLASPGLEERAATWLADPDSKKGLGIERALVRYLMRMAGRPTPFGLFAGCTFGSIGENTRIRLSPRASYGRRSRLDMDYLTSFVEAIESEPTVRAQLRFVPNSSLYRAAGRLRYAEGRSGGRGRRYDLVAVEESEHLLGTLERAEGGATPETLTRAIVARDPEIAHDEAAGYIDQLIDAQILVPELALPVTGPEPVEDLVERLSPLDGAGSAVSTLAGVRDTLRDMDTRGVGIDPAGYRQIASALEDIPGKVEPSTLIQVDMVKPPEEVVLGEDIIDEIRRGVQILHRLTPAATGGELSRFRDAFRERYEGREVPLVEVLDEEVGIGFEASRSPLADGGPLLADLPFPPRGRATDRVRWAGREHHLLRRLSDAMAAGERELVLEDEDLDRLAAPATDPRPEAFSVMAAVAARSEDELAGGNFQVLLSSVSGPSGARLLGRFCHLDPQIHQAVEAHLRREVSSRPGAVHAEVVHLPEGRSGNVLFRPVLRPHEIHFLGRGGAEAANRIPITDLLVSVAGDRIVLRSKRLGREIIPRLTTAHRYRGGRIGLYTFLCALQSQNVLGGTSWSWGALDGAPYLPRVRHGRVVLQRAQWRLGRTDIDALTNEKGAARFRAVQEWRHRHRMPRFIELVEGDNVLTTDLDNVISVDVLLDLIRKRGQAVLREMFPGPDELVAIGPEGRFVQELVIPFVRTPESKPSASAPSPATVTRSVPRRFLPGSEWLYVKLYTGIATADRVMRSVLTPLVQGAIDSGAARKWFFIRYRDPDWHLRLRFQGSPDRLLREVIPELHRLAQPLLDTQEIWRLQLDTYEREVERYGGAEVIEVAESLFQADSEAVLAIVGGLSGDEGADARWRLTFVGIDRLLDDLGYDLPRKLRKMESIRDGFAREFEVGTPFNRALSRRHRELKGELSDLLEWPPSGNGRHPAGVAVFDRRSGQSRDAIATLREMEADGRPGLVDRLTPSLIHMHANRLLRSSARAQELVLYDYLFREYRSRLARIGKGHPGGHT